MYGTAVIAVSALRGPSASAAQVSYWDEANKALARLEDLDAGKDAIIDPPAFEAPIRLAERTSETSHNVAPVNATGAGGDPVGTGIPATGSGNQRPPDASLIIDNPQLDFLGPLPGSASPAATWAPASSDQDIQTVAVPLPSSAWTGFTCLGGIAAYYLLRSVRRAFH